MNDLQTIYNSLRELLRPYQPPLVSKVDDTSHYDLWSVKDLVIDGRKRNEVFFAGLSIHKNFVGFYFMPVYADTEIKKVLAPELLRLLKGKSCFHVKKFDEQIKEQVEAALQHGFEYYRQRGWIQPLRH